MELALGTAQFGMAYGIAGRSAPMSDSEVRDVLAAAAAAGLRWLDTAAGYGDIEPRLGALAQPLGFSIVSKIPAVPESLDRAARKDFVREATRRSRERLGPALRALMFHRSEDLLAEDAADLWDAARSALPDGDVALGVSAYEPGLVHDIASRLPLELAQLPGNALDQRLASDAAAGLPPVWLRSAFLQGLLLLPLELASTRLPQARPWLERWHRWCAERGLAPLVASLAVARSFTRVAYCVVGVDSAEHFNQVEAAWRQSSPTAAPELSCELADVIDPRLWSLARP